MKSTDNKEDVKRKEEFLRALRETLGLVYGACRKTGVPRALYTRWLNDDREFAEEVNEISETALDYVESRALEEIRKGSAQLIKFYLQTKGRSRGFGREDSRDRKQPVLLLTQDEMDY